MEIKMSDIPFLFFENSSIAFEGNYSETVSENGESDKKKFGVIISILSFICAVLNTYIIVVLLHPKRVRPVNYLISNLAFVSIISSAVGILYFGDQDKRLTGYWLCGLLSYLRNVVLSLMSLTVLGISYERVRSLKPRLSKVLISRILFCIWTVALIGTLPTAFTNSFVVDEDGIEKCSKVPFLGIVEVEYAFETFRFCAFHLCVCCYMLFELYKVRSKLKYIYMFKTIPNQKMQEKVGRVRFIYIFSLVFIVIWLPLGIVISFYKSSRRRYPRSNIPVKSVNSVLLGVITLFFYLYILLCPIIILWSNFSHDLTKHLLCMKEHVNPRQGNNEPENSELSHERGTTCAKTSNSVQNDSIQIHRPLTENADIENNEVPHHSKQIISNDQPLIHHSQTFCHVLNETRSQNRQTYLKKSATSSAIYITTTLSESQNVTYV